MSATFQGTLAQNLGFGHALEICGKAQNEATWFFINLANGKFDNVSKVDIGLQMLVDIKNNMITFKKTYNNCKWKEEIKYKYNTAIFLTEFKINIAFAEEHFHIAINNKSCNMILYDIPVNLLNTIKIVGHLEYIKQVDHRRYFPHAWPPLQLSEARLDFSNEQPMSFEAGHVMIMKAKLFGNDQGRFIIHFRNAQDNQRQELHVSIRFDTKQIVRNSKISEGTDATYLAFGKEEVYGGFPFQDFSKPFKLAIALTETEFKIAKDGVFICKYLFRTPNVLPDIVGVKVFGIDGVHVRVSSINHVQLNDPLCLGFERHSV